MHIFPVFKKYHFPHIISRSVPMNVPVSPLFPLLEKSLQFNNTYLKYFTCKMYRRFTISAVTGHLLYKIFESVINNVPNASAQVTI